MALSYNKFHIFVQNLAQKVHNMATDTFKTALSNTAPTYSSNQTLSNITQISSGNGYTTGGSACSVGSANQSGGVLSWIMSTNVTFTAVTGSMATFRHSIIYDDTPTSPADPLVCGYDLGYALTLSVGEAFELKLTGTIFTLA